MMILEITIGVAGGILLAALILQFHEYIGDAVRVFFGLAFYIVVAIATAALAYFGWQLIVRFPGEVAAFFVVFGYIFILIADKRAKLRRAKQAASIDYSTSENTSTIVDK